MSHAVQWIRSGLFILTIYPLMAVMGVVFLPYALLHPDGARNTCRWYARAVMWLAGWRIGLRFEFRGTVPTEACMIAAKHQSFMDVMAIYQALENPRFIMKRLLLYAPVLGWFAYRAGCIPVDRGKKGRAVKDMLARVKAGSARPGQLCIYPQGTRVAPGAVVPYKKGSAALYLELGQPCVPVATNVGVFWPKRGIYRKPGTAVFEFCDPIAPGLTGRAFIEALERVIETRSNALAREAGMDLPLPPADPPETEGPPAA